MYIFHSPVFTSYNFNKIIHDFDQLDNFDDFDEVDDHDNFGSKIVIFRDLFKAAYQFLVYLFSLFCRNFHIRLFFFQVSLVFSIDIYFVYILSSLQSAYLLCTMWLQRGSCIFRLETG